MDQIPPSTQQELLNSLETLPNVEEKLRHCINFMRDALGQQGTPHFKGFWDVRKFCLPLFKEPLAGPVRAQMWEEYIELTREGRRLKSLLDEETAFAVEQIELAITVLESEVKAFHDSLESILEKTADVVFPGRSKTLDPRNTHYQKLQKQLNVLNIHASRINGLRKELIQTEMRIRQKNQFFQRLSKLGDLVFPPRKSLIHEVSETFSHDVSRFVDQYFSQETFSEEVMRRQVFFFREEIKTLQAMAKVLTLNTHAFSATRQQLSGCWDKLKGMEKELKKEFAEHKQKSAENSALVREKIAAFAEGTYSVEEGFKEVEAISRFMRELDLIRHDVRALNEELNEAAAPLEAKRNAKVEARRQQQEEVERARLEKVQTFKQSVESTLEKVCEMDIETLSSALEAFKLEVSTLTLNKMERQQLERHFKTLRDHVTEKQEQALLDLPEGDRETLENLKTVLETRKERRKEIKKLIEGYRKESGSSSLDFEKAMRCQELMAAEKEQLDKVDRSIADIEKKICDVKNKA